MWCNAQYCGAIEWNGYKGLVDNCNFTLNHADDNGAIGWNGNDGLVDNSNFTENYAENNAGAVCWDGENGKVFNSNFTDNSAYNAGAIKWDGENGKVFNSNFTDNTADEAGAILWNGENGNVSNSNFTKNTATYDGGAIIWQGNNGIVSKSKFLNNTAEEYYGGAIFWGNFDNYEDTNMASDGTISESVFMNNRALEKSGGAVFWQAKKGNISDNCNFFNNSATSGGAIQWKGANGHVSYSNFINNKAENAGAIYWEYSDNNEVWLILGCLFLNNSADDTAGAVRLECNNPTINNSTFINNSANSGGAIYSWNYGTFVLTNNSYFINNRAHSNGGAILVSDSICEFTDLEFKDNNATNYGGAIYLVSDEYAAGIKINNAKFNGNNATSGSAIYLDKDSEIYLENIKFGKNRADAVKITIDIDKNLTYYPSNVTIKMTLYGRDNIVNAIWNDKTDNADNVFLKNITYEVVNGVGQLENKTFYENEQGWIHPILGADSVTNKDTQIWQDDREYAQSLLYKISDEKGKVIVPWTENLTYIYGNVTEIARNYKVGNYTVEAKHEWDRYYTNVSNKAGFEVLPFVILNITKTANVTDMINGTLVNFTITVNNTSLLTATNVTVVDTLPVGLVPAEL